MNLAKIKIDNADINWYPFSSLKTYIWQIQGVTGKDFETLFTADARVLDIGAADGDLAFWLEQQGCRVDALDNPSTNYNNCTGLERMKSVLGSRVRVLYQDVDFGLVLEDQYDVAVACGLLYHLRNPIYLLIQLALHAKRLVLSTRTAHRLPDGTDISRSSVAYLLGREESLHKDSTIYWIFSPTGLQRSLQRSGWNVLRTVVHGAGKDSDPIRNDQRTFVYCERVPNYKNLIVHHHF